jgi:hypothetical protein
MKSSNNYKNEIKILLLDSIFFTNDDYLILENLFKLIDSIDNIKLKKIKNFLENNHHLKAFERNKAFYEISDIERDYNLRHNSAIAILIILKISNYKNEGMRFMINNYIEQKNYRSYLHKIYYLIIIENKYILKNNLNSINLNYEDNENIFLKLKKLFSFLKS